MTHSIQYIIFYKLIIFLYAIFLGYSNTMAVELDNLRPDNFSDNKWSGLKTVIQETKLYPTPNGDAGGDFIRFGNGISIDGDKALVGAAQLNNTGGVYVFEYDGSSWTESAILFASDAADYDSFGNSVSLAGNIALIGAPQDDDNGSNSGSVYFFELVDGSWVEVQKLLAIDGSSSDSFGNSLQIDGNRALIGAHINSGNGSGSGAAYIFELSSGSWNQTAKLFPGDGSLNDSFGFSVSLSANRALIGSSYDDDNGNNSGSAYIFDLVGGIWLETAKLLPDIGAAADNFGSSVSLDADTALIGAYGNDENGDLSGAAYIFEFDSVNWSQTIKLSPNDHTASDYFGYFVTLSNNIAVVGSPNKEINSTSGAGASYVFVKAGANWIQNTKLFANDGDEDDAFGTRVHLKDNKLIVTSYNDDDHGLNSGSVYIYDYIGGSWLFKNKLLPTDSAHNDNFGFSVSLDGDVAIIGAPYDRDLGVETGSAYIFEYENDNWNLSEKLFPEFGEDGDEFGYSVSISGDKAIVGSPKNDLFSIDGGLVYFYEKQNGTWTQVHVTSNFVPFSHFGFSLDIDGNRALIGADRANDIGSAYIFDFDGTDWQYTDELTKTLHTDSRLGYSVSLSGDRALVSAPYNNFNGLTESGIAYVFELSGGVWIEADKISPVDAEQGDKFGVSVSLIANRAAIGASEEDDQGNNAGAAYIFDYISPGGGLPIWNQSEKIIAADVDAADYFGYSVSLGVDKVLISAPVANNHGVAYLFELIGNNWEESNKFIPENGEFDDIFGISAALSGDRVLIGARGDDDNGEDSGAVYIYNTNGYTLSGSVSGLATGNTVSLSLNQGLEILDISTNSFMFQTGLTNGSSYSVEISANPISPNQTCIVNNSSGQINGFDIDNIEVICSTNQYFVGGVVTGLHADNVLVLQNNSADDLIIHNDGVFVFDTPMDDLSNYEVTILSQPSDPIQNCTLNQQNGSISGNDITNIQVNCDPGTDLIFRNSFD